MKYIICFFLFLIGCAHKRGAIGYPAPPPQGIFQYYGFNQTDSEKFISILNLISTGAYKVEEYNEWDLNANAITKYSFDIFVNKDSITIDENDSLPNTQKNYFTKRSVYMKKGKLLYEKRVNGSMESVIFNEYDQAGFLVSEKNINKNFGKITGSSTTKYQYVKTGRLFEEYNFNNFGWLSSKKVYTYDSLGNLSETLDSVKKYDPEKLGKSILYLRSRDVRKIDSMGSSDEIWAYYPKTYAHKTDSLIELHGVIYHDKTGRETSEFSLEKGKKLEVETHYIDDRQGHQISKSEFRPGNEIKYYRWDYDKKGHCMRSGDSKWVYDSKGNLIENDGPDFKNTFKIYYR